MSGRLHEIDLPVGTADIIGQIGAAGGGDELLLVGFGGDGGVELFYDGIAEGAVDVEVEFDFWEAGDVQGLGADHLGKKEEGGDEFGSHGQRYCSGDFYLGHLSR